MLARGRTPAMEAVAACAASSEVSSGPYMSSYATINQKATGSVLVPCTLGTLPNVSCAKVCLQVLASLLPSSSASPNCTASKVAASSAATSVAATREATRTSSSPTAPSSSWSGIVGREATSKTVSVGNKFGCFFQTECGRFF